MQESGREGGEEEGSWGWEVGREDGGGGREERGLA